MHFYPLQGMVALNAPVRGSECSCSVTVTIYQLRPIQLPKGRYRTVYSGTETNQCVLGPGNFHGLTHTCVHQDHRSKQLILLNEVLCNIGVSFYLEIG